MDRVKIDFDLICFFSNCSNLGSKLDYLGDVKCPKQASVPRLSALALIFDHINGSWSFDLGMSQGMPVLLTITLEPFLARLAGLWLSALALAATCSK